MSSIKYPANIHKKVQLITDVKLIFYEKPFGLYKKTL